VSRVTIFAKWGKNITAKLREPTDKGWRGQLDPNYLGGNERTSWSRAEPREGGKKKKPAINNFRQCTTQRNKKTQSAYKRKRKRKLMMQKTSNSKGKGKLKETEGKTEQTNEQRVTREKRGTTTRAAYISLKIRGKEGPSRIVCQRSCRKHKKIRNRAKKSVNHRECRCGFSRKENIKDLAPQRLHKRKGGEKSVDPSQGPQYGGLQQKKKRGRKTGWTGVQTGALKDFITRGRWLW